MKFAINRDELLRPLQLVAGVVEKRQTLPVLANAFIEARNGELRLIGTDLEVELSGSVEADSVEVEGEITVPARKLLDICKSLPDGAMINVSVNDSKVLVTSGRSKFRLSSLPATEFPRVQGAQDAPSFELLQGQLKRLIDRTAFSMAQQDVRYYLNGMLFELQTGQLRTVATDGHRLAMCTLNSDIQADRIQAILPRKAVLELARLLTQADQVVKLQFNDTHFTAEMSGYSFTTKLIDGKFPDYERVLPKGGDKVVFADRLELRQASTRAAILSNEKYRGVRVTITDGLLTMVANNPEQEEAEESVAVDYSGPELEVGFNVQYLVDVLGVLGEDQLRITLADSASSALLEDPEEGDSVYVVMPMRL